MSASYPSHVRPFTAKTDLVDRVLADHVNALQEEVATVETFVGVNPHISTAPNSAGTFNAVSTSFASLAARLANIETGIVSDAHTQYVKSTGGAVVTTSDNAVTPLTVTAKSGETADILRVTGPAGSPVYFQVTNTGNTLFSGQSLPQGRIASVTMTSSTGYSSAEFGAGGLPLNFTAVAGRKYVVSMQLLLGNATNDGTGVQIKLHDGGIGGAIHGYCMMPGANILTGALGGTHIGYRWYLDALSAGAHSLSPTIQSYSGAGLAFLASVNNPCILWVEDIGT